MKTRGKKATERRTLRPRRKPAKARKPRKCPHSVATKYRDICDEMKCWQCIRCEAKGVRSLGYSNDESGAVRAEIAAADLYSLGYNKAPPFDGVSFLSLFGFANHEKQLLTGGIWPPRNDGDVAWLAGWLLRELATHSNHEARDREAWTWDVRRPVAGQYEEWRRGVDNRIAEINAATVANAAALQPTRYVPLDEQRRADLDRQGFALYATDDRGTPIADPALEIGGGASSARLTECCPRKQWGDGYHDIHCRNFFFGCGVDDHIPECNCDRQAGPWLHNGDDAEPTMTAADYEANRLAEPDIRDDDDCPDCAACTTTYGCAEHEQFTCEVCGDLKPWTEGSADDQDGECDTCWMARVPGAVESAALPDDLSTLPILTADILGPIHTRDCDTLTDSAFPCNCGSGAPSAENDQMEEP